MLDIHYTFEIKTSRILLRFLVVLHLLAFGAALGNSLPVTVQFIVCLLIWIHFWLQWRRYGSQNNSINLRYVAMQGWVLESNGATVQIQILPSSVITPFLIIVYYQELPLKSSTRSIVCFKDALSQTAFRQLFVQLKIAGEQIKQSNP